MTVKMIAAVSQNGVIGQDNKIPWNYPEDMKWFRQQTAGHNIIMGRLTYESMGSKPLPKRRNIIVTRSQIEGVECYTTMKQAIEVSTYIAPLCAVDCMPDTYLIGGASIYKEGMEYADEIYITEIPETIEGGNPTYFPEIDKNKFAVKDHLPLYDAEGKQTLRIAKYVKLPTAAFFDWAVKIEKI